MRSRCLCFNCNVPFCCKSSFVAIWFRVSLFHCFHESWHRPAPAKFPGSSTGSAAFVWGENRPAILGLIRFTSDRATTSPTHCCLSPLPEVMVMWLVGKGYILGCQPSSARANMFLLFAHLHSHIMHMYNVYYKFIYSYKVYIKTYQNIIYIYILE